MKCTFRTSMGALGLASLAAAAPPPAPRAPTDRWVVNYDDAQCVASRNYGSEDKPLYLALKPSPMQTVVRLMLIRKGSAAEAEQRQAVVRFDDGPPIAVNALAYANRQSRHFVAAMVLPMKSLA